MCSVSFLWNIENRKDYLPGEKYLIYLSFLRNISYFLVFLWSFIIPFTDDFLFKNRFSISCCYWSSVHFIHLRVFWWRPFEAFVVISKRHRIIILIVCLVVQRWSGVAEVLCILCHWGVQLRLAYSWARPTTLVAGKGRGGMFLFLLFLHFHSCFSFFPFPLFHLFYLFSPFLWETTQKDPQGLVCR